MQKIALGLSALLLIAASSSRGATQDLADEMARAHNPDCGYVCVYAVSVDTQRDRDRSQAHFVGPQSERELRVGPRSATPELGPEVSNIIAPPRQ